MSIETTHVIIMSDYEVAMLMVGELCYTAKVLLFQAYIFCFQKGKG